MATISEAFSTGVVQLTGATADRVTLTDTNSHKVLIYNFDDADYLYVNCTAFASTVASQGTLTMDTQPSVLTASQGTLTIAEPVTDGDTFTIGSKTYTLQTTLTDSDGNIAIGGSEAQTKLNIVSAVNYDPTGPELFGGVPGTDFAASMTANSDASIAAFSGDAAVLTAKTAGAAGDTVATTHTLTHASNQFDGATLGTTTAGLDADTVTIDTNVYTWASTVGPDDAANTIAVGADLAAAKVNFVAAINASGTPNTEYSQNTKIHPTVSAAAFSGDACVLTARSAGTAGNSIATTETFAATNNQFDGGVLGTTTAGADAVPTTATAAADHFVVPPIRSGTSGPAYSVLELMSRPYGFHVNGFDASVVGNGGTYLIQLVR